MKPVILGLSNSLLLMTSLLLAQSAIAQSAPSEPSGTWLDQETNWNTAGAEIPQAPIYEGGNNLPNCDIGVRQAVLPEDALVEAAGWTLTGSAEIFNDTTVIMGMADADGMCRPLQYQVFVFSDGEFAGTLSPMPMDSRTDGSLIDYELYREGYLDASFNRYQPEDALCCASGQSRLFYEVKTEGDQLVLVPQLPADTYSNVEEETTSEETESAPTEQSNLQPSNLQTFDETAAGIPVMAQYPADQVEVMSAGSGEGVGVFFTFKPQGNALDDAYVHVFLPAGTPSTTELMPFITGPNGLIESNGWTLDGSRADTASEFPYSWFEMVFDFSTDMEQSGHILIGQTDGQAVQVTLLYPSEMADAYWPAAKTILDSLKFDTDLLPIEQSES